MTNSFSRVKYEKKNVESENISFELLNATAIIMRSVFKNASKMKRKEI